VKARVTKRREAWQLIAGVGGVVTGLLILYCLTKGALTAGVGIMTPLITVTGTLSDVFLGSWLSQRQRRQEDHQRRRVLATMLLSELRSLEKALREAYQQSPETKSIVLALTATYNQAGAYLLEAIRKQVLAKAMC
jgi:hypothetical protein